MPAPFGAEAAEIVGDVHAQDRVEFVRELLECDDVRRVGIHREQALGEDENPVLRILGADALQLVASALDRIVAEIVDVARRRLRAFLQAGMRQGVHHDMVGRTHQPLDDPEACGPAGRKERDVLHVQEFGDRLFEGERQGRVADERRRACAVDAEFLDRRNRDIADRGMGGQAQIILGSEIDAFEQGAFVRPRETLAPWAGFGRPAERPQAGRAPQLLPVVEGLHAIQKVGAGKVAEVTHASAKSRQPILWVTHSLSSRRVAPVSEVRSVNPM
jgi:hypothetical protein